MLVVRYGLAKAGGALLRSMGSQPIKVALTPDGTIFAVTQFGAVDLFHLKGGLRRKRMGVGGSARRGHNGGPQGPLCQWLMSAETSPGWQVSAPAA
jgi:hypothetical protein